MLRAVLFEQLPAISGIWLTGVRAGIVLEPSGTQWKMFGVRLVIDRPPLLGMMDTVLSRCPKSTVKLDW